MTDDTPPRTRAALADRLHELGAAELSYHLYGAHLQDALVMDQREVGWVVFYSERGGEFDLRHHATEAAACADLLGRITRVESFFFTLVAGPAPAEVADADFDAWLAERNLSRASLRPMDWKFDDLPQLSGPAARRYFVRTTALRLLT